MKLLKAKQIAESVLAILMPLCKSIFVAGSVRRSKEEVGDIEIVVVPKENFQNKLWGIVTYGTLDWNVYEDKNRKVTFRQGPKYYGIKYRGVRIEIFTADADNFGYIYWLRTGPAESNIWLMTHLQSCAAPFHFQDGYGWLGERKLALPNERDLFDLLGIPLLAPDNRYVPQYQRHLESDSHQWGQPQFSEQISQVRLF